MTKYYSNQTSSQQDKTIYSVSELNQDVRMLLENGFPILWLEGEISNFACPSSGHWYFSLKDARAQVRCAMFKNKNKSVGFTPKQGDQVLARARISLYEARGEYQLLIESMEESGSGALQREFDELKQKLQKEGLFNAAVKQPLPEYPKQIGVITSPTGAAIRDIISVLNRRFPAIPILIYPVSVQGDAAAPEIVNAIQLAEQRAECDILLLARGGGSLEDLWSFNEERVARAIFHCSIPIVSAIGHEIDFTISDFVADVRAATPSAAAELVAPDMNKVIAQYDNQQKQLYKNIQNKLKQHNQYVTMLAARLKHPAREIMERIQQVDDLELRLFQALKHRINYKQLDLVQLNTRFNHLNPEYRLQKTTEQLLFLEHKLNNCITQSFDKMLKKLDMAALSLHNISPLATLNRGYAIVKQKKNRIIRSVNEIKPGDDIEVNLTDGQLFCKIHSIQSNEPNN